ncbi:unnamed protein product [Symbiodinium necroappetens]|uniref:PPM-type phosphatase domain-containing protein n=1 Tax=Symbiodinium necroappetens TaxID=1628268 RepID=A0A812TXG8_9DINO|nr:unnamed protein product [Symbiodinium necroappetens]
MVSTKTMDHSPEKNAEEKHRLQKLGVTIDGGYVDGHLQVSRALGDIESKTGDKIHGLICKPQVIAVAVKAPSSWFSPPMGCGMLQEQAALSTTRTVLRETRSQHAAVIVVRSTNLNRFPNGSQGSGA